MKLTTKLLDSLILEELEYLGEGVLQTFYDETGIAKLPSRIEKYIEKKANQYALAGGKYINKFIEKEISQIKQNIKHLENPAQSPVGHAFARAKSRIKRSPQGQLMQKLNDPTFRVGDPDPSDIDLGTGITKHPQKFKQSRLVKKGQRKKSPDVRPLDWNKFSDAEG